MNRTNNRSEAIAAYRRDGAASDTVFAPVNYFRVEYGVHGAYRISTRDFNGQAEAEAFAARWARSNSTGHYWAEVTVIGGDVVSRYNIK